VRHESALAPLTHTSPHSSCNIAHTSTPTPTKPKCSTAPVPPTPPPPLAIFDLSLQPRTLNPVFARHCQDVQPVATSSLRFLPQGGEARVHNARAQSSSPTRPHPSQTHLHHNIPTVPNSNISPTTRHVQVQLFAPSSPRFLLRGGGGPRPRRLCPDKLFDKATHIATSTTISEKPSTSSAPAEPHSISSPAR